MNKQFLINPKQKADTRKTETIEEFLKRGGKINKLPNIDRLYCISPMNRVLLTEYMRKILRNYDLDFNKVYRFSCQILDKVDFGRVTKKEIEAIRSVMNIFQFELSIDGNNYTLKKKLEPDQKENRKVKKIVKDINDMFAHGDSLIDIKDVIQDEYSYDLDILEIVLIINHEMGK